MVNIVDISYEMLIPHFCGLNSKILLQLFILLPCLLFQGPVFATESAVLELDYPVSLVNVIQL